MLLNPQQSSRHAGPKLLYRNRRAFVTDWQCRATTFHRVGTAHAFLNRLVKGFWKLVGREEKTELKVGDDIRLSDTQKAAIAANVKRLRSTSSYSSALANILKCEHIKQRSYGTLVALA